MKTNSIAATRNSSDPNHPPLACDAQGNPIAVPEGTASWLLKRETGGRPRTIVGPDKQPARFQLDMTADEIEAMLGAGTYRVYALTEVGETIDYVTTVVVGAGGERCDASSTTAFGKSDTRGPSSDLRFALETIMQMARAQSDSLRAVSEAQADWVKGLATAKALPRNTAWAAPPPSPPPQASDDDEEEEDEEDAPEMPPWLEVINNIAPALQTYGEVLKMRFAPPPPRNAVPEPTSGPNAMVHLSEINARVTPVERKYLNIALRSSDGNRITDLLLGSSVEEAVEWVKYQVASVQAEKRARTGEAPAPATGDFMAHVMAGAAFLTAEERAAVMWLLPKFAPARIEELKAQLLAMTPQDAATWIRDNLEALRAEVAS